MIIIVYNLSAYPSVDRIIHCKVNFGILDIFYYQHCLFSIAQSHLSLDIITSSILQFQSQFIAIRYLQNLRLLPISPIF